VGLIVGGVVVRELSRFSASPARSSSLFALEPSS
jgi:hypothetical protein